MFFQDSDEVVVSIDSTKLYAFMRVPEGAKGIVAIAHGSGSSRFSPRDQFIAQGLFNQGLGVILMDLLTQEEEQIDLVTRELRFDIGLLAERLGGLTDWLGKNEGTRNLKIGYFGASTGAAAALVAAAKWGEGIHAVVSRGGRPDLAGAALPSVTASTLLIVGGYDTDVIRLNEQAYSLLTCTKKLEIVPGATHLFEESGTMEEVAKLSTAWFVNYLS